MFFGILFCFLTWHCYWWEWWQEGHVSCVCRACWSRRGVWNFLHVNLVILLLEDTPELEVQILFWYAASWLSRRDWAPNGLCYREEEASKWILSYLGTIWGVQTCPELLMIRLRGSLSLHLSVEILIVFALWCANLSWTGLGCWLCTSTYISWMLVRVELTTYNAWSWESRLEVSHNFLSMFICGFSKDGCCQRGVARRLSLERTLLI